MDGYGGGGEMMMTGGAEGEVGGQHLVKGAVTGWELVGWVSIKNIYTTMAPWDKGLLGLKRGKVGLL